MPQSEKMLQVEFLGFLARRPVTDEEYWEEEFEAPDGLRWRRPKHGVHPTKSVRHWADSPENREAVSIYRELHDFGFRVSEVSQEKAREWYVKNPRALPELQMLPRGAPIEATHKPVIPESLKTTEDRKKDRAEGRAMLAMAKKNAEAPSEPSEAGASEEPALPTTGGKKKPREA